MYKLGIDVGGTNTDAVLINEDLQVKAEIKHPTSEDIYDGIVCAVREILQVSGVNKEEITMAMLELPSVPMPLWRESIWRLSAFCESERRPHWGFPLWWTGQRISGPLLSPWQL